MATTPKIDRAPKRVLDDDFIDEALIRFARSKPYDLARYIEKHALHAERHRLWTKAYNETRNDTSKPD